MTPAPPTPPGPGTAGPVVEVTIDELVLHGFPAGFAQAERHRIAEAVRQELAHQLAGWQPPASRITPRLDGGSFPLAPGASPASTGRAIAGRVAKAVR